MGQRIATKNEVQEVSLTTHVAATCRGAIVEMAVVPNVPPRAGGGDMSFQVHFLLAADQEVNLIPFLVKSLPESLIWQ